MNVKPDNPPSVKSPVLKIVADKFLGLRNPLTRFTQGLPDAGAHSRGFQPTLKQISQAYYGIEAKVMGKNQEDVLVNFSKALNTLPVNERQKAITNLFLETQADILLLENDGRSPQANHARRILTELALRLNDVNYFPNPPSDNNEYLSQTIGVISPLLDSNSPLRPDDQHNLAIGLLDKMFTGSSDYNIKKMVVGRLTAYLTQDTITTVPQAVEQTRTLITSYIPSLSVEDQGKVRQILTARATPSSAKTSPSKSQTTAPLPSLQPSAGD